MQPERLPLSAGRFLPVLLAVLSGTLFLTRLSGTDLKEPNEPISAQAAREMIQRGDWIVPTVNGEPYPDKPPLLFWSIGLASLPGGDVSETTARLPSALAALALVLAVYYFSRRTLGEWGAFFAAATLAVSNLFVEQARYVQHDMLLCLGVTVSTLALFRLKDGDAPRGVWLALAAAALALGILDKGPVALALPALVLCVEGALERSLFRRMGTLVFAGLLGMLPPVFYYVLLARRSGWDLVQTFLFRHNMERFASGFDHAQPWWYFLAHFPVDLLPATLLLPAAIALRSDDPVRRRFHRRCWIGILVPLVFFSLSASKRPVYLLPALPYVALLAGSVMEALLRGESSKRVARWASFGEAAAVAALLIGGLAAPFLALRRAPGLVPQAWMLALLAVAGALAGAALLLQRNVPRAHGALLTSLALIWLICILWVFPAGNAINSPRAFSEEIVRSVPPSAPLKTYGLYRFRSGYIFYAHRPMPRLADLPALLDYLRREERVFCVLPQEDFESLGGSLAGLSHVLARGHAGRREEVLISNRPTPR
ncbi:MAG TPA: glycosyltransferase family 39 protein [Candidatus Polarisedimenticolia bacterium]|nr:glycosyltransferase family 39 protein [Candidatus Polarisedimenticolia bacterium]